MLDLGCGNETRIVFCLAGSSTSMSRGHLTNGRGMSEATKPVIKHAVFRETPGGIIVAAVAQRRREATFHLDASVVSTPTKLSRSTRNRLWTRAPGNRIIDSPWPNCPWGSITASSR